MTFTWREIMKKETKLFVGTTRGGMNYSIKVEHHPNACFKWHADVLVADVDDVVIGGFLEYGDKSWALKNACLKRIATEIES